MEHLKLSPECGWAINVSIEQQLGDGSYDIEMPMDEKLLDARKMTFGSNWPHENKRGWICKTQKVGCLNDSYAIQLLLSLNRTDDRVRMVLLPNSGERRLRQVFVL